ncbi:putative ESCO1/2 acetyl-transferase [Leishmania shawi]|uniref:ESCO1/2 acetyl-transferase n=1 Tax=Leishmania shawi TaxID=5680 RepID=A0AAW3BVD6_9TRYP
MPARRQLTDLNADARALPLSWRSLADIKKHVFSPGYVVEDNTGLFVGVAEPVGRPVTAATVVLCNFFSERVRRKRNRGIEPPVQCASHNESAGGTPGKPQSNSTVRPSCCSKTLRSAVLAVLRAAHESIGSAEAAGHGGCIVLVHVTVIREDVSCSPSFKTAGRAPVCYVDGVCVAEDITRAYRAVWTSPCISSELPTRSTTDDTTTAVAVASNTSGSSLRPIPVERQLQAQPTHVGDSCCTGTPFCGVRLMWVSPSSRGRGIAFSMIERARHAVCYGFVVPAEHVAFSEPTAMGSAFARRYQARDDFLVYYY